MPLKAQESDMTKIETFNRYFLKYFTSSVTSKGAINYRFKIREMAFF